MRELLEALILANIAGATAVVAVLALRLPARRWFGPRVAYGLWILPLLAALATLLPARTVTVVLAPAAAEATSVAEASVLAGDPGAAPLDLPLLAAAVWLAGVFASVAWLAWRQGAFVRAARAGLAGPAAVGLLRPRIVTPSDFAHRYTERERQVVLAHEAAHIARHDPRINALVAAARCVNWFNPLVHVLAHLQRIDQELACDAAVVAAHPQARRSYAEAMLKAQLALTPPPLGCAWLSPGDHPLAERVRLLGEPGPGRGRRRLGAIVVALLAVSAAGAAWAGKPADFVAAEPSLNEPVPAAQRIRPAPKPKAPAPAPPPLPVAAGQVVADAAPPSTETLAAIAEAEAGADAPPAPAASAERVRSVPAAPEPRRIYAAAKRSRVDPGTAVRVVVSTVDPEGRALMTDLTSFGSQHYYRVGTFLRSGSRQVLFTSVAQDGETFWVTAALNRNFVGPAIGTIGVSSGETRDLTLGNGQVVTVTATARPETPQEMADAEDAYRDVGAEIHRSSNAIWAMLKGQEQRERVRCRREACQASALRTAFMPGGE